MKELLDFTHQVEPKEARHSHNLNSDSGFYRSILAVLWALFVQSAGSV